MRFVSPPRRQAPESIVPMINVVFLLLIFFMMSATIAPAPPFDLTLPRAQATAPIDAAQTVYLARDGRIAFDGAEGAAAWAALQAVDPGDLISLRADAALETRVLAQTLGRLSQIGHAQVELVIATP